MTLKLILSTLAVGAAVAVPSAAYAAAPVVGTYDITDLGQGGHAGGPLFADGTVGGAGGLAYNDGANVELITAGSWSRVDAGHIGMCLEATVEKPAPGATEYCFVLDANAGPTRITLPGNTVQTIVRVALDDIAANGVIKGGF